MIRAPRELTVRPTVLLTSGAGVIGVITAVLAGAAAVAVPSFATASNLRALLLSVALTGIAAVGLSLITIVGRVFALSIASMIAVSTIVFAHTLMWGPATAFVLTTVLGLVLGAAQGFVVGVLRADPIITTIAFSAILLGLGQVATGGKTVVGEGGTGVLNGAVLGVPFQVLVFLGATAALWFWHRRTIAGRRITLIGLNERAALVSGVNPAPYIVLCFVIFGALVGIAGALLAAQSGQGNVLLGGTFGFDVIIAVVVGGVVVTGGAGSPFGAAVGGLFVGLLGNILALMGLTYETQLVVKGVLVLIAVVLTGVAQRLTPGRS